MFKSFVRNSLHQTLLKISTILLKYYLTFEGGFPCYHGQKSTKLEFLHIVASVLKCLLLLIKVRKMVNFGFEIYFFGSK